MLTSVFDYHLPPDLIASEPLANRAASRMLVLRRGEQVMEHRHFAELPGLLREGDLLALNDTRVVPARFFSDDGKREILRLRALAPLRWRCMVRPGRKFRVGDSLRIGEATGVVKEVFENGDRLIEFDRSVDDARHGHLALPPYIKREDQPADRQRYQTVFARHEGSIAAPTAGLHFTPELLARLPHAFLTLHVGVGTFQPVKSENIADHVMHPESYEITPDAAARMAEARRVVAVGTTVARVLESVARDHGRIMASRGETSIFIHPPFEFRAVGALLTNFHLPRSTLLMLVSAFAGTDLIRRAYDEAICRRYRFYSYGDCMLIV